VSKHGGKRFIEKELGVSHNTTNKGIVELESSTPAVVVESSTRQRKKGGGRKKSITAEVWNLIDSFIMPHVRGEPESPLLWVSKSLRHIEAALKAVGISASHRIIGDALKSHGFSLQSNRKRFEGNGHPDRYRHLASEMPKCRDLYLCQMSILKGVTKLRICEKYKIAIWHKYRDASLTGCRAPCSPAFATERHIPNGMPKTVICFLFFIP
jgi:hypothetical protein